MGIDHNSNIALNLFQIVVLHSWSIFIKHSDETSPIPDEEKTMNKSFEQGTFSHYLQLKVVKIEKFQIQHWPNEKFCSCI